MADSTLQDRLRGHAKAFDGLLSLIPAKMYYGEDTSDQWKKKKQTKQEAAAARRGKLDPDSELNRNAKEVMDERAKNKRKLREMQQEDMEEEDAADDGDSFETVEGIEAEQPLEGLKRKLESSETKKKLKFGSSTADATPDTQSGSGDELSLSIKEQTRVAKLERKAEKKAAKKSGKAKDTVHGTKGEYALQTHTGPDKSTLELKPSLKEDTMVTDDALDTTTAFSGLQDAVTEETSATTSGTDSPLFDADVATTVNNNNVEAASATTSISSTIPPSEKPKHIKLPADTSALRARLAAKIEALRAARKADGPDGKPIRTRQELIESRRQKQAQRKEHKKEMRKQAKLEEERKREEALATNSPGIMSPAVEIDEAGSFSFGRVAFADGSQMSHDMSYILNQGKRKGPSDPKTALLKVQNHKKRLQEMDVDQRNDISEKESWLIARRRAEGEKIRDDETILKKTIKRKEVEKKKSAKQWGDRLEGVKQAEKDKQKKRETNLKKRRDDKTLHKMGKKKKAGGGAKKKGGRPGFEGSFGVGGRKK